MSDPSASCITPFIWYTDSLMIIAGFYTEIVNKIWTRRHYYSLASFFTKKYLKNIKKMLFFYKNDVKIRVYALKVTVSMKECFNTLSFMEAIDCKGEWHEKNRQRILWSSCKASEGKGT